MWWYHTATQRCVHTHTNEYILKNWWYKTWIRRADCTDINPPGLIRLIIMCAFTLGGGKRASTQDSTHPFRYFLSMYILSQSCATLCYMDCSQPGSSVHGILQAGILEWIAMPSFQGHLPDLGMEPVSLALRLWQAGYLPLAPPGSPESRMIYM